MPKFCTPLACLLLLGLGSPTEAEEKPREFAHRFYSAYLTWGIRGVPMRKQERTLSPFLGIELIRTFRKINAFRDLEAAVVPLHHIDGKSEWSPEGDVFCDIWEGATSFKVSSAKLVRGAWVVECHLEWRSPGGDSAEWTDHVILDRHDDQWVVRDIMYSRGGSILENLEKRIRDYESRNLAPR